MKINRMSEEKSVPTWITENKTASQHLDKEVISNKETDRIVNMPKNLSEDAVILEKDHIEQCANSKKPYHYNTQWTEGVKSELKEYASVVGMDMNKFKPVNTDTVIKNEPIGIKANKESKVESKIKIDAFKLDSIENNNTKANWEEVNGQSNLSDKPSVSGSVTSIRNSDDYFKNSTPKTAKGQNSILEPDAIEKMINSSKEDNGSRLKRENQEKEANKKAEHKNWQNDKVDAMEKIAILPNRGKVYPTESMNAQPGIKNEPFDYSDMPEKSTGEQIKDVNSKRSSKRNFNIEKSATLGISEEFGNSLKKFMSK